MPVLSVDLGLECEGMLEKLCRVQMAEEVRHTGKTVAHAFVPAHVFAPDQPPVGIAQRRGVSGPVRLEPLRLDADERGGRPHETIENGVPPAASREAELGFEHQRKGWPGLASTARQRRQI